MEKKFLTQEEYRKRLQKAATKIGKLHFLDDAVTRLVPERELKSKKKKD